MNKLDRLKELLDQNETFPLEYIFKFIGKNSDIFLKSLDSFQKKYTHLKKHGEKRSSNDQHISMTFMLHARSSNEIIMIYEDISRIDDIVVVL